MKKKPFFKEKVVTTTDVLYFMGEEVVVTLSRLRNKNAQSNVAVWGPDDIGMQRFFESFDEARLIFESISNGVSKKSLLQRGFEQV